MRSLILLAIVIFVQLSWAADQSQNLPQLQLMYQRKSMNVLADTFSQGVEPTRDFFAEQKYLVPDLFSRHLFTYDIYNPNSSNHKGADFEIYSVVEQVFSTSYGQKMRYSLLRSGVRQLNFSFFFLLESQHFVDSWTDSNLITYVFLSPEQINRIHLIRVISHELSQLTAEKFELEDLKLVHKFDLPTEFIGCALSSLSQRPDFRLTISTLRSFTLERSVLSELELISSPKLQTTCQQRLSRTALMIQRYHLTLQDEIRKTMSNSPQRCLDPNLLNTFIEIISQSKDSDLICSSLETPKTSEKIQKGGTFGPRPGIGNGGGL